MKSFTLLSMLMFSVFACTAERTEVEEVQREEVDDLRPYRGGAVQKPSEIED